MIRQHWARVVVLGISPVRHPLQCHHNEIASVSNHQPYDCLLNRLFTRRSKKTSKLRVTGLCVRNSPTTGEFPAQRASKAENVSIWLRHHAGGCFTTFDELPIGGFVVSHFCGWCNITYTLANILSEIRWRFRIDDAQRHWSLWGENTGDRWIPLTKGQ